MSTFAVEPFPINEGGTAKITGVFKDENGAAIPGPSLTTCTLTLYDQTSNGVINGRSVFDIKGLVDGAGNLALVLYPADLPIIGSNVGVNGLERHIALIQWTYGSPTKGDSREVQLDVRQLNKVP